MGAAAQTDDQAPVVETGGDGELREGSRLDRSEAMDSGFSVGAHLTKTLGIASAVAALGVWLAAPAAAMDWLWVPGFWVIANFFEWGFHRFPMHRPMQPRILYRNHTLIHHNAFSRHDDMAIRDTRELSLVMMPWYTLLMVFGLASPIAIGIGLVGGRPMAGIFLVAAVAYFLLYETTHALYHLEPERLRAMGVGRMRLFWWLQSHHAHHHNLPRMAKVNFNVTFPLADAALRTRERPDHAPTDAA